MLLLNNIRLRMQDLYRDINMSQIITCWIFYCIANKYTFFFYFCRKKLFQRSSVLIAMWR